ncbi:unnamed protein product [Acanthocheilonema viteae]|uniref:Uncharacterized protein n=1 Tax=Acanthocheilonema viteae TaxID=6277 RepID=A0A498SQC1_ACAVI|nr:unnamed protein product [Acanthocheilonema viteae]
MATRPEDGTMHAVSKSIKIAGKISGKNLGPGTLNRNWRDASVLGYDECRSRSKCSNVTVWRNQTTKGTHFHPQSTFTIANVRTPREQSDEIEVNGTTGATDSS